MRSGQMLRQAGERRVDPERLLGGGHEEDERGTSPSVVTEEREQAASGGRSAAKPARAAAAKSWAARANASPPPIAGSASAKPQQVDQHRASTTNRYGRTPAAGGQVPSAARRRRVTRAQRPRPSSPARIATPIQTPRAIVLRLDGPADSRAYPEQPDHRDRKERRQVFGSHVARESAAGDCGAGTPASVVPDDHAGDRPEEQAFDKRCRGRDGAGARAECGGDAADETSGNEQRPAFDVDGAHERRKHGRREDEPAGRFPERGTRDTGDEERGDAELGNRQRGGLPDRHERQQCRR